MTMHISTSWIYAAFLLIAALFALNSHFRPDRFAPFSAIARLALAHRTTRFTLMIIWWWLGWHFFGSPNSI